MEQLGMRTAFYHSLSRYLGAGGAAVLAVTVGFFFRERLGFTIGFLTGFRKRRELKEESREEKTEPLKSRFRIGREIIRVHTGERINGGEV